MQYTPNDGEWPQGRANQDLPYADEKLLYEYLYGRKWTEISREFLDGMHFDFLLLTMEAWVAFLAAWMMHSLEDSRETRHTMGSALVIVLSPGDEPWMTDFTLNRLRVLNSEQRAAVRSFLIEFGQRDRYVQREASEAVKLIDSLT